MTLSTYLLGEPAEAVASNKSIAQATAIIALLLFLSFSGIWYSFYHDIPALRRLLAYPMCALINVLLIWLGLRVWRHNIAYAPPAMQRLLVLLLAWGGMMIGRSFDPTPTGVRDMFFTNMGAMSFLIPILAVCGLRAGFWPAFCRYGIHFLTVGILCIGLNTVLYIISHHVTAPMSHTILFLAPLFYLSGFLWSKRYLYLGTVGLLVWFAFAFCEDVREIMVLVGWYFFCSLFEMWHSPVFSPRNKISFLIGLALLIPVFSFIGFQTLYSTFATETLDRRSTVFFKEGGATINTRVGIMDDFLRNSTLGDIVFGRGAVATYRTDITGLAQRHLEGSQRHGIEIGHLNHTLKGGIILNVLFNSLALGAVYLGLRRSCNRFTHILAFIVLGWVLLMLTAAVPFAAPRYFLVWLAIGGCWSTELRSMTTCQFVEMWNRKSFWRSQKAIGCWVPSNPRDLMGGSGY